MSVSALGRAAIRNLKVVGSKSTIACKASPVVAISSRNATSQLINKLHGPGLPQLIRRNFSTTNKWYDEHSKSVSDLLKSELELEKNVNEAEPVPRDFESFLEKSGFRIVETPGKSDARIIKTNADGETVHVIFDVAQIANLPYDSALAETNAQSTEEGATEEEYDSLEESFANVSVVVVKDTENTAVTFELLMNMQDSSFFVDSVTPYDDAQLALSDAADAQVTKDLSYHGPPFSNLDESLQDSLESYLENRGINEDLSSFISNYSEFKENNEYINWLNKMGNFFK